MMARPSNETLRKQSRSVILDIDLDYFPLFDQPLDELKRLLTWAGRPVDFVVEHHQEAFTRWKRMVASHMVEPPHLIIHADEHHDMLSERQPANCGNFVYFAMRHWPDCRVVWVTPQPIDYPDIWLSDEAWEAISTRFECVKRFRPRWPRPNLVSVCTSPDFIDRAMSKNLLERIDAQRKIFGSTNLLNAPGRADRHPGSPLHAAPNFTAAAHAPLSRSAAVPQLETVAPTMKKAPDDIYGILHSIYAKHRRRHKENPDSKQMCCMWSTDDPPDIVEGTEPICDIEAAFGIRIDDDEALEFYDMNLDEAARKILEMRGKKS